MKSLAITVMLVLALAATAGADVLDTELAGTLPNASTTIALHAEATTDGTIWTYTYTAVIVNSSRPITGFSVQNLQKLEFSDAWNSKNLANPVYSGADSVFWNSGSVDPTDGPISFSFKSRYGPGVVDVSLFGGARSADGRTLGMVPEPASMVALSAVGLSGAAAVYRRRRPRR